jgi:hypothetical protein
MSRTITEEQVAVQIVICRSDDDREWYHIDVQAPYEGQLKTYGSFASALIQACEEHIPLSEKGRVNETSTES